jgi:hypothetical protein
LRKAAIVDLEQRRSDSFVLRVWWEEEEETPVWRGWVQHAATGDVCYFHRLVELLDFVEHHTGVLEDRGASTVPESGDRSDEVRDEGVIDE